MIKEELKKAGYKLTKPRLLVLNELIKANSPLCAQDIYEKVKKDVDLASVYRTLNLFVSLKLIFKEPFESKELYYISKKPHHHIICRKCGYSQCIECDHLFKNIKNFTNISHTLTISGICKKCSP